MKEAKTLIQNYIEKIVLWCVNERKMPEVVDMHDLKTYKDRSFYSHCKRDQLEVLDFYMYDTKKDYYQILIAYKRNDYFSITFSRLSNYKATLYSATLREENRHQELSEMGCSLQNIMQSYFGIKNFPWLENDDNYRRVITYLCNIFVDIEKTLKAESTHNINVEDFFYDFSFNAYKNKQGLAILEDNHIIFYFEKSIENNIKHLTLEYHYIPKSINKPIFEGEEKMNFAVPYRIINTLKKFVFEYQDDAKWIDHLNMIVPL